MAPGARIGHRPQLDARVGINLRCILAAKLTRLPLLGKALGVWSGNFPAHFKEEGGGISGGASASFATDATRQAAVTEQMVAHVRSGGMLGVCPEGTVNATPATLQPLTAHPHTTPSTSNSVLV